MHTLLKDYCALGVQQEHRYTKEWLQLYHKVRNATIWVFYGGKA